MLFNKSLKAVGPVIAVLSSVILVVALWLLWALYGARAMFQLVSAPSSASSSGIEGLGQLGDLFGGVNALFAALAVVGVFWAGYLQRRSLIESREGLAADHASASRQQFDATFFNLVTLFRSVLDSAILHTTSGTSAQALDLDGAVQLVLGDRATAANFYGRPDEPSEKALIWHSGEAHSAIFNQNASVIEPIFETLGAVLDHVSTLHATHPEEAAKYARIVRALLSRSFLILLAFYAVPEDRAAFRSVIERFQMLAPLRTDKYLHGVLSVVFTTRAFGDRSQT